MSFSCHTEMILTEEEQIVLKHKEGLHRRKMYPR
ncbi:rCG28608 [Rattus norvegicus]|uniref:RCG28608 n=1 Tax=Rattus norvegicus TaxID=10116 RepID=A6HVW0_RAT|nr:rCG28608 [Rattus norvegicus]